CTMISALLFRNNISRGKHVILVTRLFVANAVLNLLRSFLFFTSHLIVAGFVEMIVLRIVTLALFVLLLRKAKLAAWLLVPYLIRVLIATTLAYQIMLLN
ncbi:MAG: TspO/MBR family protein, partial [Candidatus Absconditabacterales bacterium]